MCEIHSLSEYSYFQKSSHSVRCLPFWIYVIYFLIRFFRTSARAYLFFFRIWLQIASQTTFQWHFTSILQKKVGADCNVARAHISKTLLYLSKISIEIHGKRDHLQWTRLLETLKRTYCLNRWHWQKARQQEMWEISTSFHPGLEYFVLAGKRITYYELEET